MTQKTNCLEIKKRKEKKKIKMMITKGKIEKTAKKKKKNEKEKKKANRISRGGVTRPLSQLESYSQPAPSQTRAQAKLRTIPIL